MDFVLSKPGQELIRGMSRTPDRSDTLPEQARLIEGIKPAFAPAEVLDNFARYAKQFDETFSARQKGYGSSGRFLRLGKDNI